MSPRRRGEEEELGGVQPWEEIPIIRSVEAYRAFLGGLAGAEQCVDTFSQQLAEHRGQLRKLKAKSKKPAESRKQIVTPGCCEVAGTYNPGRLLTAPDHYIKTSVHREFVSPLTLSNGDLVEYDVTKEDLEFLDANIYPQLPADSSKEAAEETFVRMIHGWEHRTGFGPPISLDAATEYCAEASHAQFAAVHDLLVRKVYDYWLERRRLLQRPLCRRFWGTAAVANKPPAFCVFQTSTLAATRASVARRPKRSQQEQKQRLYQMHSDLLQVEALLKKVIERDLLKLLITELEMCMFEQMKRELVDPTYVSPFWICLKRTKFKEYLQQPAADACYALMPAEGPRVAAVGTLAAAANKKLFIPMPVGNKAGKRLRLIVGTEEDVLAAAVEEDGVVRNQCHSSWQMLNILETSLDVAAKFKNAGSLATTTTGGGGSKISRRTAVDT